MPKTKGSFSTTKFKSKEPEAYASALSVTPTDEQAEAMRLFKTSGSLVINAGAGTGKTRTLQMLAESTKKKGQYTAFNKQIVLDATAKMPGLNVKCSTAHSMAMASLGWKYSHRINAVSPTLRETATKLGILSLSIDTPFSKYSKLIEPWKLLGYCRNAVLRYCQSAERGISTTHFPYIDGIDEPGDFTNNEIIRTHLLEPSRRLWADWQKTDGFTKYDQSAYLKMWELSGPRVMFDVKQGIPAEFVMVDEAQDLSGVMISIIEQQRNAQKIYVGDNAQAINEWMGAINALERVKADHSCELSHSFRFGPAVADVANRLLARLPGVTMRLTGSDIDSKVERVLTPKAILSRSNASAVEGVLMNPAKRHLIGGGADVIKLAEEMEKLRGGQRSFHHELVMFEDWDEAKDYANAGHSSELALMVRLVEKFGGRQIAEGLRKMPTAENAETIYSTTHKVKGLEFDTVQISSDFAAALAPRCVCDHTIKSHARGECFGCEDKGKSCPDAAKPIEKPIKPTELRLAYVGVTRAKTKLDITAVEGMI